MDDPNWNPMVNDYEADDNTYEQGIHAQRNRRSVDNNERPMGHKIYVTGLPINIEKSGVCNIFNVPNELTVLDCVVIAPAETFAYKYAFILYHTLGEAQRAIELFNNYLFNDGIHVLRVQHAHTEKERELRRLKKQREQELADLPPAFEMKPHTPQRTVLKTGKNQYEISVRNQAAQKVSPAGEPLEQKPDATAIAKKPQRPCTLCKTPATSSCRRCHVPYCGRECQVNDWQTHRRLCKSKPAMKVESDHDMMVSFDDLPNNVEENHGVLKLHQFKQEKLPLNKPVVCVLMDFRNAADFVVALTENNYVYKEIAELMNRIYSQARVEIDYVPVVSEVVAAFYPSEASWNRAVVENVTQYGACVTYVDFGETRTLTFGFLKKLHVDLLEMPIQGIKCRLDGSSAFQDEVKLNAMYGLQSRYEITALDTNRHCVVMAVHHQSKKQMLDILLEAKHRDAMPPLKDESVVSISSASSGEANNALSPHTTRPQPSNRGYGHGGRGYSSAAHGRSSYNSADFGAGHNNPYVQNPGYNTDHMRGYNYGSERGHSRCDRGQAYGGYRGGRGGYTPQPFNGPEYNACPVNYKPSPNWGRDVSMDERGRSPGVSSSGRGGMQQNSHENMNSIQYNNKVNTSTKELMSPNNIGYNASWSSSNNRGQGQNSLGNGTAWPLLEAPVGYYVEPGGGYGSSPWMPMGKTPGSDQYNAGYSRSYGGPPRGGSMTSHGTGYRGRSYRSGSDRGGGSYRGSIRGGSRGGARGGGRGGFNASVGTSGRSLSSGRADASATCQQQNTQSNKTAPTAGGGVGAPSSATDKDSTADNSQSRKDNYWSTSNKNQVDNIQEKVLPASEPTQTGTAVSEELAALLTEAKPAPVMLSIIKKYSQNDILQVEVCGLASMTCFYCKIADVDNSAELDALRDKLNNTYKQHTPNTKYKPSSTGMYAVQYDEDYYRAQITAFDVDSSTLTARYVDYGNDAEVTFSQQYALDSQFFTLPMQSFPCRLFTPGLPVNHQWPEDVFEKLHHIIQDKILTAKLIEHDNHAAIIDLYDEHGTRVVDLLLGKESPASLQEDIKNNEAGEPAGAGEEKPADSGAKQAAATTAEEKQQADTTETQPKATGSENKAFHSDATGTKEEQTADMAAASAQKQVPVDRVSGTAGTNRNTTPHAEADLMPQRSEDPASHNQPMQQQAYKSYTRMPTNNRMSIGEQRGMIHVSTSPQNIMVYMSEHKQYVEPLLNKIKKLYESYAGSYLPKIVGEMVISEYEGEWFRAKVVALPTTPTPVEAMPTYTLYYVDYGNTDENVTSDRIAPIYDETLLDIPLISARCALAGVGKLLPGKEWNDEALQPFVKVHIIEVVDVMNDVHVIHIRDIETNESYADTLLRNGDVLPGDAREIILAEVETPIAVTASTADDAARTGAGNSVGNPSMPSSQNTSIYATPAGSRCETPASTNNVTVHHDASPHSTTDTTNNDSSQQQTYSLRDEDDKKQIVPLQLKLKEEYVVLIVHTTGPADITVQPKSTPDMLQNQSNLYELLQNYQIEEPEPHTPKAAGELVCVVKDDGFLYRARVRTIKASSCTARCYLVDFGEAITVPFDKIHEMPENVQAIPCLAVHCRLAGIGGLVHGESWPIKADSKIYLLTALSHNNGVYDVQLVRKEDEVNLGVELVQDDICTPIQLQ